MSRSDFDNFEDKTNTFDQETSSMRDKLYDATSRIKDKAADMTRAAGEKFEETRDSAATALNNTAAQMRQSGRTLANENLGKVAAKVADGLERTSTYLRSGGACELRSDVEGLVRSRPAETIVGALVVGFFVGRTLTRR